jgi:hypothetical protein
MRKTILTTSLALLSAAAILPAQAAAQSVAPAKSAHYSATSTLIGKLLDDPAATEVLKKMIPTVYANEMFQQSGRTLTLKDVQQYEPDALSDANLAKIQAEFDKFPARG